MRDQFLGEFVGLVVTGVLELHYLDEGGQLNPAEPIEGWGLLLEGEGSLLFSAATDWTLQVDVGPWPDSFPTWCWPLERWAWRSAPLPLEAGRTSAIESIRPVINEVGQTYGAVLDLREVSVRVVVGAEVVVTWSSRSETA